MASLTFSVDKQLKSDLEHFSWINWSEVNRETLNRKRIFEEFLRTGELSAEDQIFCDKLNWYPIDELPVKAEYQKKLRKIVDGPHSPMTSDELKKLVNPE